MSEPMRFARVRRGSGHGYVLDGEPIPGVTTVLGKLAKPALTNWAARKAAEYALDNWADLDALPPSERLDRIRGAAGRASQVAMTRGSRVHAFGAALADGREVDVPDELAEPVEAFARFLDRWQLEPVATELAVCHTEYRYGGTLDAIYRSPALGTVIMDIKTGGVWPEAALQLAAYRSANLIMGDQPMIPTDGAYVAHVLGDDVELVPVDAGDPEWHTFLYLLSVHRWTVREDSPVRRAINLEDVTA